MGAVPARWLSSGTRLGSGVPWGVRHSPAELVANSPRAIAGADAEACTGADERDGAVRSCRRVSEAATASTPLDVCATIARRVSR